MWKKFLFTNRSYDLGLLMVRIMAGIIMIPFALELFDAEGMAGYGQWLNDVGMPAPKFMAYVGKVGELVGVVLLIPGLFTRLAAIPLVGAMFVVNFIMLEGKISESPFFLLLLFATFVFQGGGRYSLDNLIFKTHSKSIK